MWRRLNAVLPAPHTALGVSVPTIVNATRVNALRVTALALALLSPLAFWPAALDRWVLPKVLVLGVAALLAVTTPPTGRVPRWVLASVGGAGALLVIAALVNGRPAEALLGQWPRFEGLVTATGYLLALLIGARLLGPGSGPAESRLFERALAVGALALGAVSVAEAAGLRPLASDLDRPGALLGNATDQGAVAAAIAVVLLIRVLRSAHSRFDLALLGIGATAATLTVALSGSRAALIALIAGTVVAIVWSPLPARARLTLGAACVVGIAALAFVVPAMATRLLGATSTAGDAVDDRLLIWGEALRVAAANPLIGTGPGGFLDAVAAQHDARWFTVMSDGATLDSPHNIMLQALVIGGPLLLTVAIAVTAALVVTVASRARAADPERRSLIVGAAAGAGVLGLVLMTHVSSPATVDLAALLIGAATASPPRPEHRAARILAGAGIAAWVALVTVSLTAETALASGVDAARSGRVVDADAAFRTAVTLRPWDAQTVIIGAEALTERADSGDPRALAAAERWSARARLAAPGSLAAGKSAVTVKIIAGDLSAAASILADLRSRYPLDPWVATHAGAVAAGLGDLLGAERLLLEATRLDPDRPDPWLTLAYVYDRLGDPVAAADAQSHAQSLISQTRHRP